MLLLVRNAILMLIRLKMFVINVVSLPVNVNVAHFCFSVGLGSFCFIGFCFCHHGTIVSRLSRYNLTMA